MRLAIFGATGAIAGEIATQARVAAHEVIALPRDPDAIGSTMYLRQAPFISR